MLAEEGFDSLSDYLQEAQILSQMELEAETLEQEITSCREQTEELERRYGELEEKLDAKLYICDEAQLCGALGAALFAYEKCSV